MTSTHRNTHHAIRPRTLRIVIALCFGLSALSSSFHYVLDHGVAHAALPCESGSSSCLDTNCHDTGHDSLESTCAVCVSLARSLSTATATTPLPDTPGPSSPDGFNLTSTDNRSILPASPRAPPARV